MKKIQILALVLSILLAAQGLFLPVSGTAQTPSSDPQATEQPFQPGSDASVTHGPHSPDGQYPVHGSEKILKSASAAILYELTSDTLVYTWNPDTQLYPSSLTKIMTALLAIENGNLTETVTVSRRVLDTVPMEALIAGLYHEEELTLEQLIYLMMVGSANDATAIIADHIGGSQAAFVEMMNRRAQELGCTGTNFVNAHGLHDEAQVTTVRDMVKILKKAMEYPFFAEVFGAPNYTLPATNKKQEPRNFYTTNYLGSAELTDDYYDSRVTGGRTGNTDEGHRNLAVSAGADGAVYLAVVMEAKSEYASNGVMIRQGAFEDASILLDLAFNSSAAAQVLYEGQIVDQLSVINGENDVVIGPASAVHCVLPKDLDPALLTTQIQLTSQSLTAPVESGIHVGACQVFYNGMCIASVDLYTKNTSDVAATSGQSVQQPAQPGFDPGALSTAFIVLGVIFSLILILGGGLILIRKLRGIMGKNRNKKRREDRRRSR